MKFLLFNFAVIGALFYLFSADRNGLGLGGNQGEDALQALRQEIESLARDVSDGRENTEQTARQSVAAETPREVVSASRTEAIDPVASVSPEPTPAKQSAEPESAKQDVTPAPAQAPQSPEEDPEQGGSVALAADSLPQVDDPAVARRRAEVLDGVASFEGTPGKPTVEAGPPKAGPPMSPEQRLRKLYSLAEEMELLYVSKITR